MAKTDDEKKNDLSVSELLESLVQSSGAMTALVITKEGMAVAEAGDTKYLNTTAMAALVAGMFSATYEVARMVGEKQFSILLQQGESRHIHISVVAASTMLVIIFEDFQRIGRVRHEARKVSAKLSELVKSPPKLKNQEEGGEISVPEFKEYALNLIDRIFVSE